MSQATQCKNKREHCIALIEAGGATKQILVDSLETTEKSLASLFVQLRLMGKFPIKGEDGTYTLGTQEEYEASKPKPKAKKESTPKSPEEAVEAAQKRETRAATSATNAEKRYEADPCRKNELRKIIANAELELASILLGEAEERLNGKSQEEATDSDDMNDIL